jgi:glycerol-3-phosphate dehydrogenase
LPYAPETPEAKVTRRHIVRDHGRHGGPGGLLSIVGGKLTTYRELAEETVDLALRTLGRSQVPATTAERPLPGALGDVPWPRFRDELPSSSGLAPRSVEHLLRVYGKRAADVLASATTPELRAVFDPATGTIAAEVPWAFREEGARTLTDVLARRTMTGLGRACGVGADVAAARVARQTLGWDEATARHEVAAYRQWVSRLQPRALVATRQEG